MEVTYYELILDNFNFVYDHLKTDIELSNSEKNSFLEFINNHKINANTDLYEFSSIMNSGFFYKYQFMRIDERGHHFSGNLGHIVTETKFYEIIKQNTDFTSPELIESKNEFLKWFFEDFNFDVYKITLKDVQIGRYMMWSFKNSKLNKDVFSDLPLSEVACILGLDDETINDRKIAIEHATTDVIVKPTFFDAGINEFWMPGGRTKPRISCSDRAGLEEFVHKPSAFQNIINRQSIR